MRQVTGQAPDKTIPSRASTLAAQVFVLAVLSLLALSTRLLPLSISSLPFNNDGLAECRIASDILSQGHLHFSTSSFYFGSHITATPAHGALLAFVSSVLGAPPLEIAQVTVAMISVVTVVGGYLLGMQITGSRKGGLVAALVLGLFGTFVFTTGSTWRESLGIALLVMLYLTYVRRNEPRMFVLELGILALLPAVHHLVTAIAYMSIALLTTWSVYFAHKERCLKRRHWVDISVVVLFSVATIGYYKLSSLDRLGYVSVQTGFFSMALSFAVACLVAVLVLRMKKHSKTTYSPVVAVILVGLAVWNYFNPLFPYSAGAPEYLILLFAVSGFLILIAWFGFEVIIESNSPYRAVPLGMFLPVCTLFLFALISENGLPAHQIVYRGFDFADLALAMGVGIGLIHFNSRKRIQQFAIAGLIAGLVISFPFAYATDPLIGVRHDTQPYEVDALSWINQSSPIPPMMQSDERLSYIGMALYDYEKMPYLPKRLAGEAIMGTMTYYVMEDEWTTIGVNSYPFGHPVINSTWVEAVLSSSHVVYIGGPSDNRITIFMTSVVGQDKILGVH